LQAPENAQQREGLRRYGCHHLYNRRCNRETMQAPQDFAA
jgi:hypothetical protein